MATMRPIFSIVVTCALGAVSLADTGSADWKKKVEAKANANDLEEYAAIVKTLGKPIKVAFDWKSFKAADWSADVERVAGRCLNEPASVLADMAKKPEYKAALAALESITCRPVSSDAINGMTVYKLANGKSLQIDYSDSSGHGPLQQVLEDGLASGSGGSAHELAWQKHTVTYANNQAQDYAEQQSSDAHDVLKDGCGHDVEVTFDWKTLAMKDWYERGNNSKHEQMLEWASAAVMKNMGRACKDGSKYKKKLAKVKTLACHGTNKPPMLKSNGATNTEVGVTFKLKGSTLDVWFSIDSQLRDEYLERTLDGK